MKTQTLFLFSLFIAFAASAQRNFVIEYDKVTDACTHRKVTQRKNGTKDTIRISELPALSKGDVVDVKISNYNPFLYVVSIERENIMLELKENNAFSLIKLVMSGLDPVSGIISTVGSASGSIRAEGVKNEENYLVYKQKEKVILGKIEKFSKSYDEYHSLLKELYKENLKAESKVLISKFEKLYKDFENPLTDINALHSELNINYYKAGISSEKFKNDKRNFDNQLETFRKIADDNISTFTRENIFRLIENLKKADFTYSQTFVIGDEAKQDINLDNSKSLISDVKFNISFVKIQDIAAQFKNEAEDITYVKYFYGDAYYNADGNIQTKPCTDCIPVLRAEGLYAGQAPRYFEQLFTEDSIHLLPEAVGKWLFYDKNGELVKIDMEPFKNSKSPTDLYDKIKLNDYPSFIRSVKAPVSGTVQMRWATGLYAIGSFSGRKNYDLAFNSTGDSSLITESALSNINFSLGSELVFDFKGNKFLKPSLNLGAAIDLFNDRDISILLGSSLKLTKFPFIGLSAGLSFTQINILNKNLKVGQIYELFETPEDIQQKKFRPGFYFGLNFIF
jgi:hypothetical protein